jgi:hypothetical protein
MKPYMPTCQAISEAVSALTAAIRPSLGDRPRIGFAEKMYAVWVLDFVFAYVLGIVFQYYAIVPMRGSSTQTAYIFSANSECQPNQTATPGTRNASNSAARAYFRYGRLATMAAHHHAKAHGEKPPNMTQTPFPHNPEHVGEHEIEHPDRVHLFRKQRVPTEPDRHPAAQHDPDPLPGDGRQGRPPLRQRLHAWRCCRRVAGSLGDRPRIGTMA